MEYRVVGNIEGVQVKWNVGLGVGMHRKWL